MEGAREHRDGALDLRGKRKSGLGESNHERELHVIIAMLARCALGYRVEGGLDARVARRWAAEFAGIVATACAGCDRIKL